MGGRLYEEEMGADCGFLIESIIIGCLWSECVCVSWMKLAWKEWETLGSLRSCFRPIMYQKGRMFNSTHLAW